jgi:hypothetical protein
MPVNGATPSNVEKVWSAEVDLHDSLPLHAHRYF